MKKILMLSVLFVFALVQTCISPVFAAEAGYISITKTETAEVEPNVAVINFTVETTDMDSAKSAQRNNEITEKIINDAKNILVRDEKSMVQTNSYRLVPNYMVKTEANEKIIKNYTVTNSILIKTYDISKISTLIDTAVNDNVTRIGNVNFILDNQEQIQKDLTTTALIKAKEEANTYARALNQKITGVKSLDVNNYAGNTRFRLYSATANTKQATTPTPIESGKVKISSTVNISFYVK